MWITGGIDGTVGGESGQEAIRREYLRKEEGAALRDT
jgi:hypothetical protein